jgi:hypothetical protein
VSRFILPAGPAGGGGGDAFSQPLALHRNDSVESAQPSVNRKQQFPILAKDIQNLP